MSDQAGSGPGAAAPLDLRLLPAAGGAWAAAWLALVAPLAGYFEVADLAESARNSGKWRVDLGAPTTDGVHPSTVIHTAMAAGIVGF